MVHWVVQILKIATVVVVSALVLIGGTRAFDYYRDQNIPDDIGRTYTISISENDDEDDVAEKLTDAGLVQNDIYFLTRLRVENKSIEPGTYRLVKGLSTAEIIGLITTEESSARSESNPDITLTVIEGWRTEQIADELDNLGYNWGGDAFLEAVANYPSDAFDFLADRPDQTSLEGYLFPDTYTIKADTSPEDVITTILLNFDQKVTSEMRQRAAEMGLTLNQVLTFASLVEREAQVGEERPIIADVYLKRYEEGWRLDADPTVQFALGTSADWWPQLTGDDLFFESPYNTYQVEGLPPGPIANPGYSSINGVLFPAESPYYFFFARGDGSGTHLFASTLEAQQQNIDFVAGEVDSPAPGSDPFAAQ